MNSFTTEERAKLVEKIDPIPYHGSSIEFEFDLGDFGFFDGTVYYSVDRGDPSVGISDGIDIHYIEVHFFFGNFAEYLNTYAKEQLIEHIWEVEKEKGEL